MGKRKVFFGIFLGIIICLGVACNGIYIEKEHVDEIDIPKEELIEKVKDTLTTTPIYNLPTIDVVVNGLGETLFKIDTIVPLPYNAIVLSEAVFVLPSDTIEVGDKIVILPSDTVTVPYNAVIISNNIVFLKLEETEELSLREKLANTFRSQVGVRETGPNTGPEIDMYLASVGLGPGYPWCGAFASWGYQEHDLSVPETGAWTPSWFINSRIIPKEETDLADVGGIYFSNLGRIAHIVVFDEVWSDAGNLILTIEGNTNDTGSREGDGVYRKRRSKNQIKHSANWID